MVQVSGCKNLNMNSTNVPIVERAVDKPLAHWVAAVSGFAVAAVAAVFGPGAPSSRMAVISSGLLTGAMGACAGWLVFYIAVDRLKLAASARPDAEIHDWGRVFLDDSPFLTADWRERLARHLMPRYLATWIAAICGAGATFSRLSLASVKEADLVTLGWPVLFGVVTGVTAAVATRWEEDAWAARLSPRVKPAANVINPPDIVIPPEVKPDPPPIEAPESPRLPEIPPVNKSDD